MTIRDKALFANKLSALVDAGVPILRSLDLMRMQQRSKKMRMALAGMTQDVNQGDSLGNSMRRWPKVFDNLSIALVEAGKPAASSMTPSSAWPSCWRTTPSSRIRSREP